MASKAELALILSLVDEVTKTAKGIKGELLDVGKTGQGLQGTLKQVGSGLASLGTTVIVGGIAAATAGVAALGGALATCIGPASDLSETVAKVGVVFGEQADEVLAFGEQAAAALGLSKEEALAAAGTYGNLFRAMEMSEEVSADMSTSLVQLAADLASFNNMDPTEVLDKLRAGLTGETEPLKSLGVNLNAAAIEAQAMEMGLIGANDELTAAAKAQASYALIMEQTALAQGDFARNAKGLANQERILKATFSDLRAEIGTAVLPVIEQLAGIATEFLQSETFQGWVDTAVSALTSFAEKAAEVIGLLADGDLEGALTAIFGSEMAGQIMAFAQTVSDFVNNTLIPFVSEHAEELKAALIAIGALLAGAAIASGIMSIAGAIAALVNPVTLVIAAVGLLAAAWAGNWGGIRDKTQAVIDWLRPYVEGAITAIREWWAANGEQIMATVANLWGMVQGAFNSGASFVSNLISTILAAIKGFWDAHGEQIMAVVSALWETVKELFNRGVEFVKGVVALFQLAQQGKWREFGAKLREIVDKIWEGIKEAFTKAKTKLGEIVTQLIENVKKFFRETDWGQVGSNIIEGIKNGILGAAGFLADAARSAAQAALDAAKGFLGISSPSRVAAEMIGRPFVEGIGVGIDRAMDRLANTQLPQLTARLVNVPAAGMQAQGGNTYQLHIHSSAPTENIIADFDMLAAMAG